MARLEDSRQAGAGYAAGVSGRIPEKGQLRPDERAPVSRILPGPKGAPLARWFWVPEWDLPDGVVHEALTLPFPACQLVVESEGVHLYGPVTSAWRRDLVGRGWAVGALLTPGAAHALLGEVLVWQDRVTQAKGATRLHGDVASVMDGPGDVDGRHAAAARLLEDWLVQEVGPIVDGDPDAPVARRLVDLADGDPALLRVDDLALRLGVSVRTVQRLASSYVGMSPAAIIRRRRLQEAAERVRQEPGTDLATIAADLGYADHAHLTREFGRTLGFTPTRYRAEGCN